MPKMTVKQFAEKNSVESHVANGVIKFLESKEIIKKAGIVPKPEGQRGRSAHIYEFPETVSFDA